MQQLTLLPESIPALPVTYYPNFLGTEEANALYQHCLQLQWQQNQIKMLGKTIPVPRLECIYGDKGCNYLYSKSVLLKPLPWTQQLAELQDSITAFTGHKFNIVIGNQYRSGQHSIGWQMLLDGIKHGVEAVKSILGRWGTDLRWSAVLELEEVAADQLRQLEELVPQFYTLLSEEVLPMSANG